jgi:hypothetical protein
MSSYRTFLTAIIGFALSLFFASTACAQFHPDFSGTWKQDGAHSVPARSGDVTLHIEHHDPDLIVETTILRPLLPRQHAVQRYTTDDKPSVSTGADGDTFQTHIAWRGEDLDFTIVEHEDGRTIETTEFWSLTDSGVALKRVRHSSKSKGEQVIIYTRSH